MRLAHWYVLRSVCMSIRGVRLRSVHSGRKQRKKMIPTFSVPFHLGGFAVREAIVGCYDADPLAALIKRRRTKGAAELQSELCSVACSDGLKHVNGSSQSIREREDFWTAAPNAFVAHRTAVRLRSHVVLLSSSADKFVDCDRLISFQMQRAVWVRCESVNGEFAQLAHTVCQRLVVHVEVTPLVFERHADGD